MRDTQPIIYSGTVTNWWRHHCVHRTSSLRACVASSMSPSPSEDCVWRCRTPTSASEPDSGEDMTFPLSPLTCDHELCLLPALTDVGPAVYFLWQCWPQAPHPPSLQTERLLRAVCLCQEVFFFFNTIVTGLCFTISVVSYFSLPFSRSCREWDALSGDLNDAFFEKVIVL